MKRIILLLCCLLLASCTNTKYDEQIEQYNRFLNYAKNITEQSSNIPFDINIYCEKLIEDEITYHVIIDNPKEEIKNIKAIAVHDLKTEDIYPTSGLFEKPLNLIPNKIDLNNNNAKGIILVGYIDYKETLDSFKINIKVFIEYTDKNNKLNKIYYIYHK